MNKVLKNYNRSKNRTQTPTQMVATVFDRCALWLGDMAEAIAQKKYYERYQCSEKVLMALTHLMPLFDESSEKQKKFSKEMSEFCFLILANMTEISQKENHILCLKTKGLIEEMASVWKKI